MNKKIIMALALIAIAPSLADAKAPYSKKFRAAYPNATPNVERSCAICHSPDGDSLNVYGLDLEREGLNFQAIEALDSDGDGFTNIQEINANTSPSNRDDHP